MILQKRSHNKNDHHYSNAIPFLQMFFQSSDIIQFFKTKTPERLI